jgi:hypothetical protein
MPIAFMLVSVNRESEVLAKLRQIEGTQVYMIYGPHNVIARFEAETMDRLNNIMKRARIVVGKYRLRTKSGEYEEETETLTLVVAE